MKMKKNVEKMLRWLEADQEMRRVRKALPGQKAWLTKAIGISGANQMKGSIATLRFLLEGWED